MNDSLAKENEAKIIASHGFIADFERWSEILQRRNDAIVLAAGIREYQHSLLSLIMGQYRQAYSGLRLVLELGLAAVHFSSNELQFRQWSQGQRDIVWSNLISADNGVLSKNFLKVFGGDMSDEAPHYRALAEAAYRELSEFVHGNASTHNRIPSTMQFHKETFDAWNDKAESIRLIVLYVLAARHLFDMPKESLPRIEDLVMQDFSYLPCVRAHFGAVTGV